MFRTLFNNKKWRKHPKSSESDLFQLSFDRSWISKGWWDFKSHVSWDSHFCSWQAWSLLFALPRSTLCYTSFRKVYTTMPATSNCLFTTVVYRNCQRHTVKLPEKVKNLILEQRNDLTWMMYSAGQHKCTNKSHVRNLRSHAEIYPLGHLCEVPRSYSDPPHSVGSLRTSYRSVAETFTRQHTTFTRHRYLCTRRDSDPQSQQASGRRPTP